MNFHSAYFRAKSFQSALGFFKFVDKVFIFVGLTDRRCSCGHETKMAHTGRDVSYRRCYFGVD